jgi:small subunit ribosomal protein S1
MGRDDKIGDKVIRGVVGSMEKQSEKKGDSAIAGYQRESDLRSGEDRVAKEGGGESSEKQKAKPEDKSFIDYYEESLRSIQEGSLVRGEIVHIGKEFVLVDIGYKSEGHIPIHEFMDGNGKVTARVGDGVDVVLEGRDDDEGIIILSKEKAAKIRIWDDIKEIYEKGGKIKGRIVARVKGGMSVDIGLPAFLPGSQINLKPIKDFDSYIGTVHWFKILKYNKRRSNIVLSRRALLESERMSLREKTLQQLKDGAVLLGTVKNITEYGLFIDLGGIDGLLHITDMSWGRVGHPSELHKVGDSFPLKVLHYDQETGRVSLGLKQLKPDPWTNADAKYPPNTRIKGRVVSLADYGAFVEVEEGVEGLIHVSEMSWTRKIRHPSQVVKVGDNVEALVLSINPREKRISLGLKQTQTNPWDLIGERYPVGTTIEGRVKNITEFGLFIGIDEGIDGLIHISDISWVKRIKHPSELYRKGQDVQAVVLSIDKENERFSLGIKQLTLDPWDKVPTRYKSGTRVTGKVTNVTDFGVFVELEEGIEGLIHVSEISKDKGITPLSRFNVDDVIEAKVINVSRAEKKIGLSAKRLDEGEEREIYKGYMESHDGASSNLGDILKKEMQGLESQSPTGGKKE